MILIQEINETIARSPQLRRTAATYFDHRYPLRDCAYCNGPYRGPARYCRLAHAMADAQTEAPLTTSADIAA